MLTLHVEYEILLPMPVISNNEDSIMIKCACHSHALEIMFDDWDKDTIPMIYMGIWTHGQRPMPLRWRDRLRWIYYLLKDGRLHADDVVINEHDAITLANFLSEKSLLIKERVRDLEKKHSDKAFFKADNTKLGD